MLKQPKLKRLVFCLFEENGLRAPYDGSLHVFPCDIVGNEGACAGSSGFKSFLKCLRMAHCILTPHKYCNSGFNNTLTNMKLIKVDLKSDSGFVI
ncbi:hypothetical protein CR513_08691, partial [Mucuna pruriens]